MHTRLRLAAFLAWLGQLTVAAVVIAHRSVEPTVFYRYSTRHALLVATVVAALAAGSAWLMRRWHALPDVAVWLDARAGRSPAIVVGPLASGALVMGAALLLRALIDLILPVALLLVGTALTYAGFVAFVSLSLSESARSGIRTSLLLVFASAAMAGVVGETILRLVPPFRDYRVLPAGLRTSFDPGPGIMPGVVGPSVFSTNGIGVRGDPYPAEGRYNVLAVGGSTTECAYLDDAEAWPYLTQTLLNRDADRPPVWVGNVGRSGHSVVENILVVRHFVPQMAIDAVIVIAGINDLVSAWRNPDAYDASKHSPDAAAYYLHRAFARRPLHDAAVGRPFPENTALFNLAEMAYWRLLQASESPFRYLYVETRAGESYVERRRIYQEAAVVIDEPPDLAAALDQYGRNLETLIDDARRQGIRLILATQPTMYHEELSAEGFRMLWLGRRTDGDYRYSIDAMARAMDLFNDRLLQACRAERLECVDLAAVMNGKEAYFYDDVHFNEAGAAVVAEQLAAALSMR